MEASSGVMLVIKISLLFFQRLARKKRSIRLIFVFSEENNVQIKRRRQNYPKRSLIACMYRLMKNLDRFKRFRWRLNNLHCGWWKAYDLHLLTCTSASTWVLIKEKERKHFAS